MTWPWWSARFGARCRRRRSDRPRSREPHAGAREVYETREAARGLVVAGGEAAVLLEAVLEDLDEVTLLEDVPVVGGLRLPRGVGADDGGHVALGKLVADPFRVVGGVGKEHGPLRVLDQRAGDRGLVRLTCRELDVERQTESIHESVDLGGEASARAANGVVVDPPFPPAACWWLRTMVASAIDPSGSTSTRSARKTLFHSPCRAQLRKRL